MENTIIKEMPIEVQERIDAIVESEFDLDIRVFTLTPNEGSKEPQAASNTCALCSVYTCQVDSCYTCSCFTCATCLFC